MDNSTIFLNVENPRRGRQARNLSETDPKILDLKSSSEQIIFPKIVVGCPCVSLHVLVWQAVLDIKELDFAIENWSISEFRQRNIYIFSIF